MLPDHRDDINFSSNGPLPPYLHKRFTLSGFGPAPIWHRRGVHVSKFNEYPSADIVVTTLNECRKILASLVFDDSILDGNHWTGIVQEGFYIAFYVVTANAIPSKAPPQTSELISRA